MRDFDYLVVGGGTAGCIIAARPCEDPTARVGFFEIGYLPEDNVRSATSTYYLHPVQDRPNLTVLLDARATRTVHDGECAAGVQVLHQGEPETLTAAREVIICAGAIDSRGRVWISSDRVDDPPQIDYDYFTDADGHDEAMLLQGIELSRRIAQQEPMASWIGEELFPAPYVDATHTLSGVARASHQTAYHVSGTCRMGAVGDPAAVPTPELAVQGMTGLSVCDASIFPILVSTNPVVTVMMAAERAVDLIRNRQEHR